MATMKTVKSAGSTMVTDGVMHVASTGIPGSVFGLVLDAPVDEPNDTTGEIWNSATGAKTIVVRSLITPGSGEATIVGWSTTSGDTDVEANLALAVATHASPDGEEYPNQAFLTPLVAEVLIVWDGVTTIKRLAAQSTAAGTAHKVAVTYVA